MARRERHRADGVLPNGGCIIASQLEYPETIDLGPLDALIGYHLRRASAALGGDFTRTMDGTGMRQVPFAILSVIAANPGINQGNVGRALGIQRPNMVALANELVKRGLIARQVDPADRRAFVLNLTPAGRAALSDSLARIRVHEARMLADLSEAERDMLIRLLARIEAKGD